MLFLTLVPTEVPISPPSEALPIGASEDKTPTLTADYIPSPASSAGGGGGGGYSMRTITLPETHIFTPEKGTSTISQSVERECYSPGGEILVETITHIPAAATSQPVVIKEYRDIEYSLDTNRKSDTSVPIPPISSIDELRVPKKDNFPIFGTSPTEGLTKDDDEFSDFQVAPPPPPPVLQPLKPKPANPVTLSPEHLLQQNWASSTTVDDDEMLRIEAFARSKNTNALASNPPSSKPSNTSAADDDEWSDFVCSAPAATSSQKSALDDDWSDFVFTTPASGSTVAPKLLPASYTAGKYVPWSTGQSTTPAIAARTAGVPELGFVAPKPPIVKHQFMRKWLLKTSNGRPLESDVIM